MHIKLFERRKKTNSSCTEVQVHDSYSGTYDDLLFLIITHLKRCSCPYAVECMCYVFHFDFCIIIIVICCACFMYGKLRHTKQCNYIEMNWLQSIADWFDANDKRRKMRCFELRVTK